MIIKMTLEANALFWDEDGCCIGDETSINLENGTEINYNIPGLQQWCGKYLWQCLVPIESGEVTKEELTKTFDWSEFHKKGIEFAKEVKKLLPENVILKYSAPFEDGSNFIKDDMIIE